MLISLFQYNKKLLSIRKKAQLSLPSQEQDEATEMLRNRTKQQKCYSEEIEGSSVVHHSKV